MTEQEKIDRNRIKVLYLPNSILTELLLHCGEDRLLQRFKGMPKDAKVVGHSPHFMFRNNEYTFKVWSSEFDSVPEAHNVPEMQAELLPFDCPHCYRRIGP